MHGCLALAILGAHSEQEGEEESERIKLGLPGCSESCSADL
jgi:hypothetical protein